MESFPVSKQIRLTHLSESYEMGTGELWCRLSRLAWKPNGMPQRIRKARSFEGEKAY
jgi:hypothetical protein